MRARCGRCACWRSRRRLRLQSDRPDADAIPALGLLDDLLIVPLGVALVIRMTPARVLAGARRRAQTSAARPASRAMAAVIVVIWLAVPAALALRAADRLSGVG